MQVNGSYLFVMDLHRAIQRYEAKAKTYLIRCNWSKGISEHSKNLSFLFIPISVKVAAVMLRNVLSSVSYFFSSTSTQ